MCSNYFEKLILQARQLDNGIEKLTEIWKVPHVLVGRFAECTTETNFHIQAVWNTIKNTQDGLEEILSGVEECETQDSIPIEQFLQETKEKYESLKEQSDDLETVLAEYGYHYENNTLVQTNANNSGKSSLHLKKEIKDSENEFTPNLSWKCKMKQKKQSTPTFCGSYISDLVSTPVVDSLASGLEDTPIMCKDFICSSITKRPQEPIFSKHFYSILKK